VIHLVREKDALDKAQDWHRAILYGIDDGVIATDAEGRRHGCRVWEGRVTMDLAASEVIDILLVNQPPK
jgi:hypothetical protein